jgi:hypothetical protein
LVLIRRLLTAGETVVDIAAHLTVEGLRNSRSLGNDDVADAVTIAPVALRPSDLPRVNEEHSTLISSCSAMLAASSSPRRPGSATGFMPCCW